MKVKPKDIICHLEDERIRKLLDKRVLCGEIPTNMIYEGILLSVCGTPNHPFEVYHDNDAHSYFYTFIAPIIKENKYRPFANAEEFKPYRDKWMLNELTLAIVKFDMYGDYGVGEYTSWEYLFNHYIFEDGTPCGVEIE